MDEAEYDMKIYADREGRYPPKPKAEADNTLRDLHNSSYHTKAEFNNCFINYSKYFQSLNKFSVIRRIDVNRPTIQKSSKFGRCKMASQNYQGDLANQK